MSFDMLFPLPLLFFLLEKVLCKQKGTLLSREHVLSFLAAHLSSVDHLWLVTLQSIAWELLWNYSGKIRTPRGNWAGRRGEYWAAGQQLSDKDLGKLFTTWQSILGCLFNLYHQKCLWDRTQIAPVPRALVFSSCFSFLLAFYSLNASSVASAFVLNTVRDTLLSSFYMNDSSSSLKTQLNVTSSKSLV